MGGRDVLDSWKDIAAYLKRDIRTCQNWEKELGLPVHRLQDSPKARVFAYKDEIDRWVQEKLREREAGDAAPRRKVVRLVPIAAGGLVLLAVVGVLVWRLGLRPDRPTGTPDRPTIAVLDFENLSGDPTLDYWRDGLSELIITGLSQSRFVSVLTREQVDAILKRLDLEQTGTYTSEDLVKIAAAGEISEIVTGSLLRAGERIVITLTLLDVGDRKVVERMSVECLGQDDVVTKANNLVLRIKQDLKLSEGELTADAEAYKRLEIATTASAEAYRYFLEGRRYHGQMAYPEAISYMQKAVEIDPQFAMAYRSIASAYSNLARMDQAMKFARKALDLSARLPELERMLIEAFYDYWKGENARSIETFRRLLRSYPGNLMAMMNLSIQLPDLDEVLRLREFVYQRHRSPLVANNLAHAYMRKGLYEKAEEVSRSFLTDVEDNPHVRNRLMDAYLCRRQFGAALAENERIALPRPGNAYFKVQTGDIRLLMGDLDGAEEVYRQLPVLATIVNRPNLAILDLARGKLQAAVEEARKMVAEAKDDPSLTTGAYEDIVQALEKAGRTGEAFRLWAGYLEEAAARSRSVDEDSPLLLPRLQRRNTFVRGRLAAEQGDFPAARRDAAELGRSWQRAADPRLLRYPDYILGLVELGEKKPKRAAAYFRKACARLEGEAKWEDSRELAMFYDGLARALYEAGDLAGARAEYERITLLTLGRLSHGDLYAKAFYHLGLIAERQGDKARARENYSKFLDLWKDADPGLAEVLDARTRLAASGR